MPKRVIEKMTISGKVARYAGWILIPLALVGSIALLQTQRLKQLTTASETLTKEQLLVQDEMERLRLATLKKTPDFGYGNLLANWTFLNFLQYFGDRTPRRTIGYQRSPEYFEIIVDRDPRYRLPYLFLSVSSSIFAAQPDRSIALMEKGLQSMAPLLPPDSFFVWRYKGIDELLFLGDGIAARQSFETAALWADQSPDPEAANVAGLSRQTAAYLAKNPSSVAAQISAWTTVMAAVRDDYTRQLAVEKIEALGGKFVTVEGGRVVVQFKGE